MSNLYCTDCGKAVGTSSPCKYCPTKITDSSEHYIDKHIRDKVINHIHRFRYYQPQDTIRFNACHNCKYWMYHPLRWCYKCGAEVKQDRITVKELQEKYLDYREGY